MLFGLLTWPLASSIRSLPLYSPWVADRLWQIVVLFWPQQLLNFFIAWPLVGYAAIAGLVFYSILCVVVQLCHRLFAWDTIKNGSVEIGIAFKFRISFRIEKVDDHGAKLNDNRYRLVDSSDDLQVKITKQQESIEEPNAATVDYQRLYEELRKQHKQDQKAVGQDAVPKDVGPRHKNIDDLSISTKSHMSRQEKDLAITHGDYTPVSDIKQSIHTHGISESVESRRELAYLRRTSKSLAAQLDDREEELKAEKETSAPRAEVDRANLTSLAAAEKTVASLNEQLKDLRGSLDVSLERVGELENELHTARGELGTARGELESHAAEATKAKNRALASFSKTFPGGFDIIPTAGTDTQCGFHAVIESIKAMNLSRTTQPLPVPYCADLLAAYKSHDVQQSCHGWCANMEFSDKDTTAELGRTGYFSIEQAFQALDHWASTEHGGLKFQIGYLKQHGPLEQAYQPPQLVGCKHDDDPDCIVVWLHHNGAGEDSLIAHYSGMRNHTPRP